MVEELAVVDSVGIVNHGGRGRRKVFGLWCVRDKENKQKEDENEETFKTRQIFSFLFW